MGRAVALRLAAGKAKVLVNDLDGETVLITEQLIRSSGGDAVALKGSVISSSDVQHMVDTALDRFGSVHILVNNAANPVAQPIGEITAEAFAKSFEVNVRGPLFLFQACLPHLLASDHASVVNVISAGAFLSTPGVSMYGAGKAALQSFTRSMAAEYAARGIRINALAPGATDTTMVRNIGPEASASMARASHCLLYTSPSPRDRG